MNPPDLHKLREAEARLEARIVAERAELAEAQAKEVEVCRSLAKLADELSTVKKAIGPAVLAPINQAGENQP